MKVSSKIGLSIGVLSFAVIISTIFLIWATQRSVNNHERVSLSYQSLERYLELSNAVTEIFSYVHRDVVDHNRPLQFDPKEAEAKIFDLIEEIEDIEQFEFDQPWTEDSDLSGVEKLKTELNIAFADIHKVLAILALGNEIGRETVVRTLDERADLTVLALIEANVMEERTQLDSSIAVIRTADRQVLIIATVFGAFALLSTATIYFVYIRRIQNGLAQLTHGATLFGSNNLSHRISMFGDDEFSQLGAQLNEMANCIQSKQSRLNVTQTDLEERVSQRTAELRKANVTLEERDASRRRFFAQIGHELRTPVTAIRGQAEVALRARKDPAGSHKLALESIVKLSDQLTSNVGDLFLIAREEAGLLSFHLERIDFAETVSDAVAQMQSVFDLRAATLEFTKPDGTFAVDGDRQRLVQLVQILLTNAVTHGPTGIDVQVRMTRRANEIGLEISDNGPGLPVEDYERVLNFGERKSSGSTRLGTGLGLPLAKSIVGGHSGTIEISSSRAGGISVLVALPSINAEGEA